MYINYAYLIFYHYIIDILSLGKLFLICLIFTNYFEKRDVKGLEKKGSMLQIAIDVLKNRLRFYLSCFGWLDEKIWFSFTEGTPFSENHIDKHASIPRTNTLGREIKSPIQITNDGFWADDLYLFEIMKHVRETWAFVVKSGILRTSV